MQGMAIYKQKICSKIPKEIINLGRIFGGKVLMRIRIKGGIMVS
jgi:hypothetical protein